MRPARILLLAIAIVAGGLAAFFATRGEAPTENVDLAEAPSTQVLVATRSIGIGERLTPAHVQWQDWPEGAVRPEYLTSDRVPDAPSQMAGTVARFEIFVGEPIRDAKLVRTDQGYLSAVITPGMRAVSVAVTAVSGAGGFIVPNDRVDIVLTRRVSGVEVSETILNNVRVLAIGHRLGELGPSAEAEGDEPQAQTFERPTIATVELNPVQAESVLNAELAGDLSLVLRSVVDFADSPSGSSSRQGSSSVSLIRYGKQTSVASSTTDTATNDGSDVPPPPEDSGPVASPVDFQVNTFDSTSGGSADVPAPAPAPGNTAPAPIAE